MALGRVPHGPPAGFIEDLLASDTRTILKRQQQVRVQFVPIRGKRERLAQDVGSLVRSSLLQQGNRRIVLCFARTDSSCRAGT